MTPKLSSDFQLLQAVAHDVGARINSVPRVSLGEFPTPLTRCDRFSALLGGPTIFIKREDLSGLGLGGNKSRLLEFRLAEALALKSDVVVAGLEAQSNSARQLTAAANRLGLRTRLVLRPDGPPDWQGNLLVDRILGAEIAFLPDEAHDMDAALVRESEALREQGSRPYVMNHAKFFGIGASLAGLEWTIESCVQLESENTFPTHFYLSSGGKCQSGMVIASQLFGSSFAVVGMNAHPGPTHAVNATLEIGTATINELGLEITLTAQMVENRSDYAGERFGVPTADGIEAIELLARAEGIILDPVFSGKAMAGLIDDIRTGRLGSEDIVVFVHTGGVPAIFKHAASFLSAQ